MRKQLMACAVLICLNGCARSEDGQIGPKELPPLEMPEATEVSQTTEATEASQTTETTEATEASQTNSAVSQDSSVPNHMWDTLGVTENIEGCQYVRWMYHWNGADQFEWLHRSNCTNCWTKIKNLIQSTPTPCYLPQDNHTNNMSITNFGKVFTFNGCQYAVCYGTAISYTHIGSCTNCWARMEELIKKYTKHE